MMLEHQITDIIPMMKPDQHHFYNACRQIIPPSVQANNLILIIS